MTVEEVAARFNAAKFEDYFKGTCPCCQTDLFGNLTIRAGNDGGVLVKCYFHCPVEDILEKVGLSTGDLLPASIGPEMCGSGSGKAVRA